MPQLPSFFKRRTAATTDKPAGHEDARSKRDQLLFGLLELDREELSQQLPFDVGAGEKGVPVTLHSDGTWEFAEVDFDTGFTPNLNGLP